MPSSSEPAIRRAVDADGVAMATLIAGVFAEYPDCPFVPEEFPELAAPASYYEGKGGRLWVAERPMVDGVPRLVGSLAVAPHHETGTFELFKVYADPAERGRGLAASLLELAVGFVQARDGRRIVLYSDTRFERGHAFYRKHGFQTLPGVRALHDVARTLEYGFARDLPSVA